MCLYEKIFAFGSLNLNSKWDQVQLMSMTYTGACSVSEEKKAVYSFILYAEKIHGACLPDLRMKLGAKAMALRDPIQGFDKALLKKKKSNSLSNWHSVVPHAGHIGLAEGNWPAGRDA